MTGPLAHANAAPTAIVLGIASGFDDGVAASIKVKMEPAGNRYARHSHGLKPDEADGER